MLSLQYLLRILVHLKFVFFLRYIQRKSPFPELNLKRDEYNPRYHPNSAKTNSATLHIPTYAIHITVDPGEVYLQHFHLLSARFLERISLPGYCLFTPATDSLKIMTDTVLFSSTNFGELYFVYSEIIIL